MRGLPSLATTRDARTTSTGAWRDVSHVCPATFRNSLIHSHPPPPEALPGVVDGGLTPPAG